MLRIVKVITYCFLAIFVATASLTLVGLAYVWFGPSPNLFLPYLGWLIAILIVEVVGVVVMFAKRGLLYLPETKVNSSPAETSAFMRDFIGHGSSVTIVSNRLGWLVDDRIVQDKILDRLRAGTQFEFITSQPVDPRIKEPMAAMGARFIETDPADIPEARFTLINADRSGAERLAIARGTHPQHEITIFDSLSGPQIIGLAKDVVRKSRP